MIATAFRRRRRPNLAPLRSMTAVVVVVVMPVLLPVLLSSSTTTTAATIAARLLLLPRSLGELLRGRIGGPVPTLLHHATCSTIRSEAGRLPRRRVRPPFAAAAVAALVLERLCRRRRAEH